MTARQQREFYKSWIRSKPCCWCQSVRRVTSTEVSHHNYSTLGPSGMGIKCSDYRTVPLCSKCHRHYHDRGSLRGNITHREADPVKGWRQAKTEVYIGATETRDFLQRRMIDCLVEFLETMLNSEVL